MKTTIKISEYNKFTINGWIDRMVADGHIVTYGAMIDICREVLKNPNKAILYINHSSEGIRFMVKYLLEQRDMND